MTNQNKVNSGLNPIENLNLQELNEQESEKLQGGIGLGLGQNFPDFGSLNLPLGFPVGEQPIPVEPDGGIGDGGGQPMPVEPDGGIGN